MKGLNPLTWHTVEIILAVAGAMGVAATEGSSPKVRRFRYNPDANAVGFRYFILPTFFMGKVLPKFVDYIYTEALPKSDVLRARPGIYKGLVSLPSPLKGDISSYDFPPFKDPCWPGVMGSGYVDYLQPKKKEEETGLRFETCVTQNSQAAYEFLVYELRWRSSPAKY